MMKNHIETEKTKQTQWKRGNIYAEAVTSIQTYIYIHTMIIEVLYLLRNG